MPINLLYELYNPFLNIIQASFCSCYHGSQSKSLDLLSRSEDDYLSISQTKDSMIWTDHAGDQENDFTGEGKSCKQQREGTCCDMPPRYLGTPPEWSLQGQHLLPNPAEWIDSPRTGCKIWERKATLFLTLAFKHLSQLFTHFRRFFKTDCKPFLWVHNDALAAMLLPTISCCYRHEQSCVKSIGFQFTANVRLVCRHHFWLTLS